MTIYGSAGWKLNAAQDSADETLYFHNWRFSAGVEFNGLVGAFSGMPTTLSIEPTYTLADEQQFQAVFGEERSQFSALEITAVIPAGEGRGVLFESIFSKDIPRSFRVGVIFTTGTIATAGRN